MKIDVRLLATLRASERMTSALTPHTCDACSGV